VGSFGQTLKDAREARGLSLDEVAKTTRIARHHLEALEKGDLDALPAGPFAKGFIEAYAKALGLDPRPAVDAYRREAKKRGAGTPEAEERMLDELAQIVDQRTGGAADRGQGATRWGAILIGSGVVVALAIGAWLLVRDGSPREAPAASLSPSTSAAESAKPESTDAAGTEAPREVAPARTPTPGPTASARGEPTPTPAPPRPNPDIAVSDSGVGTGVKSHQLVGAADEFVEGTEVVFWTRVVGGRPGDVIHHVWLHEGRGIARIPLHIGGSPWRTFSRRPLPQGSAGRWTAEARDVDGRLLARQEFVCVAPSR